MRSEVQTAVATMKRARLLRAELGGGVFLAFWLVSNLLYAGRISPLTGIILFAVCNLIVLTNKSHIGE